MSPHAQKENSVVKLETMIGLAGIDKATIEALTNAIECLKNPQSLVDEKQVAELQKTIDSAAEGSIESITAQLALAKISKPDTARIERDAVTALKTILREVPLSEEQAQSLGLPHRIVEEAMSSRSAATTKSSTRTRVSSSDVRKTVLAMDDVFTVSDIASGASVATETKVVKELIKEGLIEKAGLDKNHSGRGRAPMTYRIVT